MNLWNDFYTDMKGWKIIGERNMYSYKKWRIQRIILTVLKYASALINIVQLVQFFMGWSSWRRLFVLTLTKEPPASPCGLLAVSKLSSRCSRVGDSQKFFLLMKNSESCAGNDTMVRMMQPAIHYWFASCRLKVFRMSSHLHFWCRLHTDASVKDWFPRV